MRYLFFDIECADGKRAICEYGYVLCDEKFNVTQKKNILINPECEFNLVGREKQVDLILSYPYEEYYKHNPFNEFYENIRFLMTQKDLVIFGHGLENDIRYIIKACNRYELEKFDYIAYDVQMMLPVFSKKNAKYTSLEKAFVDIVPESIRKDLIDHRAVDDAFKTMLVFKSMVVDLEFSVQDLLESCPESKISALEYWKKFKSDKEAKDRKRRGNDLWNQLCEEQKDFLNGLNYIGKIVCITGKMKECNKELKAIIRLVKGKGYVAYSKIDGSDYVIAFDETDKKQMEESLKRPYSGQIITLDEFMKIVEGGE